MRCFLKAGALVLTIFPLAVWANFNGVQCSDVAIGKASHLSGIPEGQIKDVMTNAKFAIAQNEIQRDVAAAITNYPTQELFWHRKDTDENGEEIDVFQILSGYKPKEWADPKLAREKISKWCARFRPKIADLCTEAIIKIYDKKEGHLHQVFYKQNWELIQTLKEEMKRNPKTTGRELARLAGDVKAEGITGDILRYGGYHFLPANHPIIKPCKKSGLPSGIQKSNGVMFKYVCIGNESGNHNWKFPLVSGTAGRVLSFDYWAIVLTGASPSDYEAKIGLR